MSNLFGSNNKNGRNTFRNIGVAATNALNTVATNTQSVFGNIANGTQDVLGNIATNTQKMVNTVFNIPNVNRISPVQNTSPSPYMAISPNTVSSPNISKGSSWTPHPILKPIAIFIFIVIGFIFLFSTYSEEINQGLKNIVKYLRELLGYKTPKDEFPPFPQESPEVTRPPVPPQEEARHHQRTPVEQIVESILPAKAGQVFNVENNEYTYYDAEPLCRALGAELATYDQVKDAWNKGADWCNYGWVKGQVAVYPTQEDTYNKLQNGPAEERGACGDVGLNGGYFDNPEMRFGVNCYGKKPSQTDKAAAMISQRGTTPSTPDFLQFDKKVHDFKNDADSLDVLPWNPDKWSDV